MDPSGPLLSMSPSNFPSSSANPRDAQWQRLQQRKATLRATQEENLRAHREVKDQEEQKQIEEEEAELLASEAVAQKEKDGIEQRRREVACVRTP